MQVASPKRKQDISTLAEVSKIEAAAKLLKGIATHTPLSYSFSLSEKYGCDVYLKREDLQVVRSYKLRGAYNKMRSIPTDKSANGIVCASAGNHAQGVAYACNKLQIHGKIYMPSTTPKQKVRKVGQFGKDFVEVVLTGDTFDDAYKSALEDAHKNDKVFVHPFDDPKVIV